ncbi:hypothetical protein RRG08_036422 [Elysia crispata]|uniref:Uncharacterized protein n=1 Tax=Elysia crispata TaxID=231223 RepID=A0AAE1DHJ6_9GAST|nr:hypothetical protein RRG08_036422 [Elysia crispata]
MHENFTLKLKALKIEYNDEFWQSYLCDGADLETECWRNECDKCKCGRLFLESMEQQDNREPIVWKKWCKDKSSGRIHIEFVEGWKDQLLDEIGTDWQKFLEHVRVKRIQSDSFEKDKANPRVTVCHCDFAMAYSCSYQDEIQSALWSRASVNLFTVALYQRDLPCRSLLFATNHNDKGKNAVLTFLRKVVEGLKHSDVGDCFILYTDGPSSEFKNKFTLKTIHEISQILQCEVRWQYFATSHGKGVVDGIGGAAKSAVRKRVLSKTGPVVQCASDFVREVRKDLPRVKVTEVTEEEISVNDSKWKDVDSVPGIKSVHCISYNKGICKLYQTNNDFISKGKEIGEVVFQDCLTDQTNLPMEKAETGD